MITTDPITNQKMRDQTTGIDASYAGGIFNPNTRREVIRWMGFIERNIPLVNDDFYGKRIMGVYSSIDGVDPILTALIKQGMLPEKKERCRNKYTGINYRGNNLLSEMWRQDVPPVRREEKEGYDFDSQFDVILLSLTSEDAPNPLHIQRLADVLRDYCRNHGTLVVSRSLRKHMDIKDPEIEEEIFKRASLQKPGFCDSSNNGG